MEVAGGLLSVGVLSGGTESVVVGLVSDVKLSAGGGDVAAGGAVVVVCC